MANPSKQKGTAFETAVVEFLNAHDIPCERRALHGNTDKGDIAGVPEWTFELKNRKALALGDAVDEAAVEAMNAKTLYGVAVIKRPRKGDVAHAFAVMPLAQLVTIIHALRDRTVR